MGSGAITVGRAHMPESMIVGLDGYSIASRASFHCKPLHDNDRDIPALKRLEEFAKAGYTFIPTPLEGPMTWRLRRIKSATE